MAISLYTSRLVLEYLGIKSFGVYTVVASLSMMFTYFSWSISSSLTRFLAFDIANDDLPGLKKCFSSSLLSCVYISGFILVLCETIGIWALYHVLDIPPERLHDAFLVFQATIIVLILDMLRTCCQSLIIAYEKMSFFAYVSITESVLKLGVALLLAFIANGRLVCYAFLLSGVSAITLLIYIFYCRRYFPKVKFTLRKGRERIKEIMQFTGWNALASFADLCYIQGTSIILNVFYGVAYNATMGITNQVKNAVYSFSKNLQTAAFPHMTKEYALKNYASFEKLTTLISNLSFLLLYLIGLPIIINAECILNIWLVVVPPQAAIFMRLVIVFCLIDSLVGPLWTAMQSYGRLKTYQIIISIGWLLSLPTLWIVYEAGAAPESLIVIQIIFNVALLVVRIFFATRYCHINLSFYLNHVIWKLLVTAVISGFLPIMAGMLDMGDTGRLFLTTGITLVTVPLCAFFIALTPEERVKVSAFIKKKIKHE